MALSLIMSPASPAPAYQVGTGEFTYKDERTVTGTANSAGFLQLTITGIGADVAVGDYVWYSELQDVDDRDTAVALITAEGTNTITLDAAYDAGYSGGNIRLMNAETFVIKTGYSGVSSQPKRTSQTLTVRADLDGVYRVSCQTAVKTRFNWEEPNFTDFYHNQVQCVGYPTSISEPSNIVLLKQRAGITQQPPISYSNFRGIITEFDSGQYKVYSESNKAYTLLDGAADITLRYILGNSIDVMFETSITDSDTTTTPALPSGLSFITENSGQTLTGIRIAANAVAATINGSYEIQEDSGGGSTVTYRVTFATVDGLAGRTECESKSVVLVWWSPDGGWQQYSFEMLKTYFIDGNTGTIVKGNDGRSAIQYEDIIEGIELKAELENESVLDVLNTLHYSTQIFIASITGSGGTRGIDTSSFTRVFTEGGGFELKKVQPYKANMNDFALTVYKSAEVISVGQ